MRDGTDEAKLKDGEKKRYQVVVVGAGASGLICAHTLLKRWANTKPSTIDDEEGGEPVLVLEGRDRIGGRILTNTRQGRNSKGEDLVFRVDEGAAWVHGTGLPWPAKGGEITVARKAREEKKHETEEKKDEDDDTNNEEVDLNPMVSLLATIKPKGRDVFRAHLIPISPMGNPWMRPRNVLHSPLLSRMDDHKGTKQHVALYVSGARVQPDAPSIHAALDLHEKILHAVSRVGLAAYRCGEGMEAANLTVADAIDVIREYAPKKYGLGYRCDEGGDGEMVESLVKFYQGLIECWMGCPLERLQLSEMIREEESADVTSDSVEDEFVSVGDYPGPHCTVRNGMESVLQPLLEDGVREIIRCSEEVIRIERDEEGGGVHVTCRSGLTVKAKVCVVTMSVGCLQHAIAEGRLFHPKLSQEKEQGINALNMGFYKKVQLTFDDVFWPSDEPFIGLVRRTVRNFPPSESTSAENGGLGNCLLLDNFWARDGIPCIEAVLTGNAGIWAKGKNDDFIRDEVLRFMEQAMGPDMLSGDNPRSVTERCISCHITRWEEDQFSRGAYSYLGLGTLERHCDAVNSPEWGGTLLLAGEANVSEEEGSVHGAFRSGSEAAEKAMELVSI